MAQSPSKSDNTHNQGTVKDPEHDGRLKENREAGKTKGTTQASHDRAEGHPHEGGSSLSQASSKGSESRSGSSHSGSSKETGGSHASGKESGGTESEDLKSREYKDAEGNVHHHTTKYAEQHKGE